MRKESRGDVRTWTLLVLALVPTFAVLVGAVWLWADRSDAIEGFESSLVQVDTTYELFSVVGAMLRAESSLRMAALPDASEELIGQAETDRLRALVAVERADEVLPALLTQVTADTDDEAEVLSLMGGAIGLAEDLFDRQVAGEPLLPEIDFLTQLARGSASGLVLPFTNSTDQDAVYFYEALSSTIDYYDQFDRDRAAILSAYRAGEPLPSATLTSVERGARWRDVTYSRRLVPENVAIEWFATATADLSDLPTLIESNEPLGTILASSQGNERDYTLHEIQKLDATLTADVDLAFSHFERTTNDRLELLATERKLTAFTSLFMALLGIALPWLTISEVRRRRRVEAAHAEAVVQLSEKAERDPSTGAWNRRRLESSVESMIDATSETEVVVLAYLDLDHFKAINDVWGHSTGDEVLRTVTERLSDFSYRETDFELCRFGGDEFVLYAKLPAQTLAWLEGLGSQVLRAVGSNMRINGRSYEVAASAGIAMSNAESTLDSLLLEADSSLLLAKQERGSAVVYNRDVSRTGELVHALPDALAGGEIRAHIQPAIHVPEGQIVHVEALARWERPSGESVSPAVFIPLVESYGLAEQLTTTILGSVADFMRKPTTPDNMRVWVNVSPRELDVANFSERFVALLHQMQLPASRIGIEITETAAVRDPKRLAVELRRLRALGICVAIDDFGSGYSPLGYLRFLPVDLVKLDRSLITDIDSDRANQHIVIGVVGLADELGIGIVAEGVERDAERDWLLDHDVETMQGFLFERPMAPELLDWRPRPAGTPASVRS